MGQKGTFSTPGAYLRQASSWNKLQNCLLPLFHLPGVHLFWVEAFGRSAGPGIKCRGGGGGQVKHILNKVVRPFGTLFCIAYGSCFDDPLSPAWRAYREFFSQVEVYFAHPWGVVGLGTKDACAALFAVVDPGVAALADYV